MQVWSRLSTRSQRAMLRVFWRRRNYQYKPRGNLLNRLSSELGISKTQVIQIIHQERKMLLKLYGKK